ncbi:LytR/AlgR family response regulator transcription factor [Flammeovirga pacifica]|uniref:DNA-binding response regulator n=1 Tax=Flammeovirga pacifica TaxID=915059 RepID=A0A1S1YWM3_FLAPC|nr:LytTR family DNA-binding domain-containing protein [Flammeovirga pacifica]OHX65411.1 DNA-binding response regulator [Flammeovirga pacifica]
MIKTIIVEDEFNALSTLKKMLAIIAEDIDIVGESDNVEDAIQLINSVKPQLVLLDIELIGGNAFQVLEACDKGNFNVIFTTAYDQFAIKAFKFDTFDYLLKPIDIDELEDCLKRFRSFVHKNIPISESKKLSDTTVTTDVGEEKLLLKTSDNQYIINVNDIIRCQSDGSYTTIYTQEKQILISRNLKYYEGVLNSDLFFRVHQSHLVNLKYIKSINSNNILTLKDHSEVPVSTRKKASLQKVLKS